jgi:uncharacterized protein YndB with AHSA1/START domain
MVSDRIEREIVIAAPVDRVWSEVIEFAFGVGEADLAKREIRVGSLFVADYQVHGRFPLRIEKIEPKRFLSYRWASAFPGVEPKDGNSTHIAFTLTTEGEATRLHVVESGFASLDTSEETRRKAFDDNTNGWTTEFDALKKRAELEGSVR